MKKFFILFAGLLILFAGVDSLWAQGWRGRGRVTGNVKDQNGNPLDGVIVKFSSDTLATSTEVKADKNGNWTIAGIRGSVWNVDFVKDGYKTVAISTQILEAGYNQPIKTVMEKLDATVAPKEAAPSLGKTAEARALMDEGEYQGAVAKYQEALIEAPTVYQIHGDLAAAYFKMGDSDKAIESYKNFLDKEKAAGVMMPNQQVLIAIASIYMEKKDFAKAKEYLASVDESQVTDPIVFYNIGVSYYNANDTANAIKYFEKSVQVDPKFSDGYFQLGLAYVTKGDNAKTTEYFKKVIDVDPTSDNAKQAQEFLNAMQ